MQELVSQLGIDWRLFLSQALNFIVLLVVLRVFAYKPILKILKDRQMKISDGLTKAKEAQKRLEEAGEMATKKLKEADRQALQVLRETETRAKEQENALLAEAKRKEAEVLENTELILQSKAEEAKRAMREQAAELVKSAIVKTVELDPKSVDEALIEKAVKGMATPK